MTDRKLFWLIRSDPHSRSTWLVVVCLTIALCYLVPTLARLSTPDPATFWPVWPGCAILVAGLLLVPLRIWPVLMIGSYGAFALVDVQAGESVRAIGWFVPANTIEVLIAALGLRYFSGVMPRLNSVRSLAKYFVFAIALAPLAAAFLSARGIRHEYWLSWRMCFFSQVLAFITITPTLLSWVTEGPVLLRKSRTVHLEGMALLAGLIILSYIAFRHSANPASPALLYSLVPFLLWSALRFGMLGITTSTGIVASLSIWAALHGHGPFSGLVPLIDPLSLQLFLIFTALPFMLLAAVVEERKLAQEELRTDEEKLRLLLESAAEAICGIDLEGRCTFCNPTCIRLLGYGSADELLGMDMHLLIHHSRPNECLSGSGGCSVFQAFQMRERFHSENVVLWKADGTSFPAEYWCHPQRKGDDVVGAVIAFTDITERKRTQEVLAGVGRKLIEAQDQERARIARELHDDIAQRLALLAIELAQVQQGVQDGTSEERRRIATVRQNVADISTDIQTMSHHLHSSKLEYLGLVVTARGFCQEFSERQKMKIDFESRDVPTRLPQEISLCLFRVLQEALHNAAKHSGVNHFEVQLWGAADGIHLTVVDSGAGFELGAVSQKREGLGLTSMQERVKLVNGTFEIESKAMCGTTVHACVPFDLAHDARRAAV